ncbi:MAG: polymer-forming cytoskeletal protein [Lachnospiraceae bacterium]|nr:polymer-forming cytoskeletal protein [Lachnospiraceae bacterium]
MSFFKDFKEDLSQAVDELMPGSDRDLNESYEEPAPSVPQPAPAQDEMNELDALLEKVSPQDAAAPVQNEKRSFFQTLTAPEPASTQPQAPDFIQQQVMPQQIAPEPIVPDRLPASDETTIITGGTVIHGDVESTGSLDISGSIEGNVSCRGKLTVTGSITGNSSAEEVFADSAHISGEIVSNGTVKIGLGSVIVGNVTANSAVVAGAIKGDIDVHGPVVVDTSAVVMGNIKSRSVQINNGAVIEGFCSQSYAEIDVEGLFNGKGK